MKVYTIDVPAYVTLRVWAKDEADAVHIVKEQCALVCHDFIPNNSADFYEETEVPGVEVSGAVTIYGNPKLEPSPSGFDLGEPMDVSDTCDPVDDEETQDAADAAFERGAANAAGGGVDYVDMITPRR